MPLWGDHPVTFDDSDSLHSAMFKLESSADPAPVVLLDSDCQLADNVLLYRLLERSSQHLRAPIAVVTHNPRWRKLAREHGLSAYASIGSLRRSRRGSAVSRSEDFADSIYSSLLPSLAGHGRTFAAMLLVGLMVVLGLGYLFLPVMKVTVQATVETLSNDVRVRVDTAVTNTDQAAGVIPGRLVQHRFSSTDFIDVTGHKSVGKDRAAGEVTVINSSPALVGIPSGTVLVTASGQRFATTSEITVGSFSQPRNADRTPTPSATPNPAPSPSPLASSRPSGVIVKVPVRAIDPGTAGNAPALAITRFESDSLRGLTVFNEQPIAGGSTSDVTTVTAEDRDRLKEALFQRAQSQALSELQVRLKKSESLIPHSMQVVIETEDYDKEAGEETKQLKGSVQVLTTAIAFSNPDLNGFVQSAWEQSAPRGARPLTGEFQLAPPEVIDAGPRTAELKVKVTGKMERVLEVDKVAQSLRGLSVQEAKTLLTSAQTAVHATKVELWPGWAQRAYRVEVTTVR